MNRICGILAVALFLAPAASAGPSGYHLARTVPLPGDEGWDALAIDQATHRLFVTHGTHVVAVDLADFSVAGDIPNTPRTHGAAFAPGGLGFISDGGDDTVTVFDAKTLAVSKRIAVGKGPDAIIYDPATKKVLTFNGGSKDATVIDVASLTVDGTIPLSGKPEFATADGKGKVFANIEDTSEIVVIDPRTMTVLKRWPLAPCEEPSGIAIDTAHHRLFSGCHNKLMAVSDARTGKIVATPPTGQGVDGADYDPATHLVFSPNGGDGTLTVIREVTASKFEVIDTVQTQKGARTMVLDPRTHNVYLVTADFGPPIPPATRPSILPGTVRLLVYEK